MQFLSTDAFDNKGIATFRHASLLSKKLRFKGADETEVGYAIYVPPAYENSSARYPILYFLAGNGGNENGVWHVVVKAHELIGKGELPPFIIVGVTGGRSFYGNQFEGRCQMQDFFLDEFVPHIEKNYRVKTEARYRHLQGMSAGGNGALLYAVKRPDLFGTVTAVAGAFFGVRVNAWAEMYDAKEANYRPYDPFTLIAQSPSRLGNLHIALWIGSEDVTRNDNVQMHRLLTQGGIAHTYNDASSRPLLQGVPHQFDRYYALYGKEILQFHAEAFGP